MLSDEQIFELALVAEDGISPHDGTLRFARAIESAATAPLLARIAELQAEVVEMQQLAASGADALMRTSVEMSKLEQQLAEARKQMEAQKDEWLSWEAKRRDLEKDAELLDWLDNNIFAREPDEWDQRYGVCRDGKTQMWAIFAPKGVHGSARRIIADAIRARGAK